MTNPITTPEQMREAAAQLADLLSGSLMDQHNEAKEYGIFGHGYLRSASDDVLRLAAAIRAIPCAPQPEATPARDVRAAALREAAATVTAGDYIQNIQRRILALIDKEPQP